MGHKGREKGNKMINLHLYSSLSSTHSGTGPDYYICALKDNSVYFSEKGRHIGLVKT